MGHAHGTAIDVRRPATAGLSYVESLSAGLPKAMISFVARHAEELNGHQPRHGQFIDIGEIAPDRRIRGRLKAGFITRHRAAQGARCRFAAMPAYATARGNDAAILLPPASHLSLAKCYLLIASDDFWRHAMSEAADCCYDRLRQSIIAKRHECEIFLMRGDFAPN